MEQAIVHSHSQRRKENFTVRTFLGGLSSTAAGFILHPVDTCKIRLQKQGELNSQGTRYGNVFKAAKVIISNESFLALYKGVSASMLRESTYSTLRLGLYEPFKYLLGESDPKTMPFWKKILSGGLAGCVSSGFANPADLLKVRLQAEEHARKSLVTEIKTIWTNQGVRGFYRGTLPTMTRAVVLNATQMPTYDHCKHTLLKHGLMKDGTQLHFLCSFFAGFCMTVTTAPFDLTKTRLMAQPVEKKLYSGMFDCFQKSIRSEGVLVLWRGFGAQWLRMGPFTIIQVTVWEKLRSLLGMRGI